MADNTQDAFMKSMADDGDSEVSTQEKSKNPLVGRVVSERYRVDAVLGQGGMGLVFKAWDQKLSRTVAIKTLQPGYAGIPEIVARFEVEAKACAQIRHPGVVGVLNVETAEILGRVQQIIVMEYVEGRQLTELIRERGGFDDAEVRDIGVQIMDAVAALHSFGVTHRDLKPANILVRGDGERMKITLVDLGLAKIAPPANRSQVGAANLTELGGFLGTVAYCSPEQVLDASTVTHRTDLYSCGVMLYELIAGRPPFQAPTNSQVKQHHLTSPVPPVHLKAPGRWVPPDIEAVLHKAMAKSPDGRYPHAVAMRDALYKARLDPQEYQPARRSMVPQPVSMQSKRPVRKSTPPVVQRRVSGYQLGIVAVLIASLGAVLLLVLHKGKGEASPSETSVVESPASAEAPAPSPTVVAIEPATAEKGCELSERGRHTEAVEVLEVVVKNAPKDADAWYCLATSAAFAKDDAMAARAYRAFLGLKPKDADKRRRADGWLRHNASK